MSFRKSFLRHYKFVRSPLCTRHSTSQPINQPASTANHCVIDSDQCTRTAERLTKTQWFFCFLFYMPVATVRWLSSVCMHRHLINQTTREHSSSSERQRQGGHELQVKQQYSRRRTSSWVLFTTYYGHSPHSTVDYHLTPLVLVQRNQPTHQPTHQPPLIRPRRLSFARESPRRKEGEGERDGVLDRDRAMYKFCISE